MKLHNRVVVVPWQISISSLDYESDIFWSLFFENPQPNYFKHIQTISSWLWISDYKQPNHKTMRYIVQNNSTTMLPISRKMHRIIRSPQQSHLPSPPALSSYFPDFPKVMVGYGYFENPGVWVLDPLIPQQKDPPGVSAFSLQLIVKAAMAHVKTEAAGLQGSKSEIPKPLSRARLWRTVAGNCFSSPTSQQKTDGWTKRRCWFRGFQKLGGKGGDFSGASFYC